MERKRRYTEAITQFNDIAQDIDDDQWENATPCKDWNVRALVTHVTRELLWAPKILAGKTIDEVGNKFDGDILGDDPKAVIQQATNEAIDALDDALGERTVYLSYGKTTADAYMEQNMCDIVVHTWDLAQGIGAEEDFSEELIDACYKAWGEADLSESGLFETPVTVPNDADTLTKLLARTGRDPWQTDAPSLQQTERPNNV